MSTQEQEQISSAALCRSWGWGPGTVLEARYHAGTPATFDCRILITAIGEQDVLARQFAKRYGDGPWLGDSRAECLWDLALRDWRKVEGPSQGAEEEKVTLVMTCPSYPEQYDAYLGTEKIGYLRLRHGCFYAEYLGDDGDNRDWRGPVFVAYPWGDGEFAEKERAWHLNRAVRALLDARKGIFPDQPVLEDLAYAVCDESEWKERTKAAEPSAAGGGV